MPVNYSQLLRLVAPQVIVILTALVALTVDLLALRHMAIRTRFVAASLLSSVGCMTAICWIASASNQATFFNGMLVITPMTQFAQIVVLALAVGTLWIAVDSNFTHHAGEYVLLILFATAGMMFLASAQNLLIIFISIELLSLSLYALAGFDKRSPKSAEAALKYFLFGGMSAAFLLFGMSLLYGLSGSADLAQISRAVQRPVLDPLLLVAIVMVIAGLGFKVAAVPFHLWAPDAYQGAPAPSAAFIASSSKVAGFFILAQVMLIGLGGAEGTSGLGNHRPGWTPVIAAVAAASMVLGNLVAIVQSSVRRLLAYSAIGHAGYMLLGILAQTPRGLSALLYYVTTYAVTTLGAFAVVGVVEERYGGDTLDHFSGLGRREPVLSFCMMIFMLSLAGVPPLAGFFGKFYLFSSALSTGPNHFTLLWLVVLAIAMSAVSLYYYLQVLKRVYVRDSGPACTSSHLPVASQIVICVLAIAVVVLGCAPTLLLQYIRTGITSLH